MRELLEKKEDELELCFKTSQYLLSQNISKGSSLQKMDFKGGSVASDQGFGGACMSENVRLFQMLSTSETNNKELQKGLKNLEFMNNE